MNGPLELHFQSTLDLNWERYGHKFHTQPSTANVWSKAFRELGSGQSPVSL